MPLSGSAWQARSLALAVVVAEPPAARATGSLSLRLSAQHDPECPWHCGSFRLAGPTSDQGREAKPPPSLLMRIRRIGQPEGRAVIWAQRTVRTDMRNTATLGDCQCARATSWQVHRPLAHQPQTTEPTKADHSPGFRLLRAPFANAGQYWRCS